MAIISMNFHGNENEKFNDDVYIEKVFPAFGSYRFTITPINSRFWRWGIRFSTTPRTNFSTEDGRHNNPLTPDIHLGAGQWDQQYWSAPYDLDLVQYHIPGFDHFLVQSKDYQGGVVKLEMAIFKESPNYNIVSMVLSTADMKAGPTQIRIRNDLKYFTPFAWADKTKFDLSCEIEFDENLTTDDQFEFKPSTYTLSEIFDDGSTPDHTTGNHWLLKLNPEKWPIRDLESMEELYFGSHNSSYGQRPEYELFHEIKVGDTVLVYAMAPYNEIVCLWMVQNSLHSHPKHGEIVDFTQLATISKPIPLHDFAHILTPEQKVQIDDQSKIRLIKLSLAESNEIQFSIPNNIPNPQYYPSFHAEGNHREIKDQLDFENDIRAIASLISLKQLDPPLAIGLFGNWGAGKSFFMEKILERVEQICNSKNEAYINNAVQVRFNAWHYEDANLWASLMSEILESLNDFTKNDAEQNKGIEQIYESLEVSHIQSTIIDEQKKKLEEKVIIWKARRKDENDRLLNLSGLDILKSLLSDKKVREDFKELKTQDLSAAFQNIEQIKNYIKEAESTATKIKCFLNKAGSLRGYRWTSLFIGAIIIFASTFLMSHIPSWFAWWKSTWNQVAIGLASAISTLTFIKKVFKPYKETFKNLNERLQSLQRTVLARQGELKGDLTPDEKELLQLGNDLERLNGEIKESEAIIENIVSGKALSKFIREQYTNSNYAKQLGIVSAIRKDFHTLNHLLKEQQKGIQIDSQKNGEKTMVQFKIDRIILYIDDLDRCSEQTVIKVLEAIHLMLAFPLFVVIVGVDPRWLNNAINYKLGKLLRSADTENMSAKKSPATSYDYLEKIFQIPFTIKPIKKDGREKLIEYLLNRTTPKKATNENDQSKQEKKLPPEQSKEAESADTPALNLDKPSDEITTLETDTTAIEPEINEKSEKIGIKFVNNINTNVPEIEIPMVFSGVEIAFIKKASCLFGDSPRTINRYINIYRIIRIHKSWKIPYQFSDDHRATLILLAIVVGKPEKAKFIIDEIRKSNMPGEKLEKIISNHPNELNWLKEIATNDGLSDILKLSVQTLQANIDLVARFSFRTI